VTGYFLQPRLIRANDFELFSENGFSSLHVAGKMSKVFYLSLIALLSTTIFVPVLAYQDYKSTSRHSASILLRDFWRLDLSYILTSLLISGFFFGYRFWEHIAWPLVTTAVQLTYLLFSCAFVFSFYSDPVGFFASREKLFRELSNPQALYLEYRCCGFAIDPPRNECGDQISCARAIARAMLPELMGSVSRHIALAGLHIAAGAAIWVTHAFGGIEFDQPPQNQPQRGNEGYVQVLENERDQEECDEENSVCIGTKDASEVN
jgi:hypothetical protein